MTEAGRYVELPLPADWRETLDGLRELVLPRRLPAAPCAVNIVDEAFRCLDERETKILFRRHGTGLTLQELGDRFGLTRERIRQIENKALETVRCEAHAFLEPLEQLADEVRATGFAVFEPAGCESQHWPGEPLDVIWRCAVNIYLRITQQPFELQNLPTGGWALCEPERNRRDAEQLASSLSSNPMFLNLADAAELLGIEASDLAIAWPVYDGLYLTESGLIGYSRWTNAQHLEALAWALSDAGFDDWHFSEAARALEIVFPDRFTGVVGRNIAALVSRPDISVFQQSGRKGYWKLRARGDGFTDNRAAVAAVLEAHDLPLPAASIHALLERDVARGTIDALLARDPVFRSFGRAMYGLAARDYPACTAEGEWLRGLLLVRGVMEAEEVERLAQEAGITPDRLRGAVALAPDLLYMRVSTAHASYQHEDYFLPRRFDAWFQRRFTAEVPAPEVLRAGFEEARSVGDTRRIHLAVKALQARGVRLADEISNSRTSKRVTSAPIP